MFSRLFLAFGMLLMLACNSETHNTASQAPIQPDAYLSPEAQDSFKYSISRFVSKYPSEAGRSNMWEPRFDEAYAKLAKAQKLTHYYVDSVSGTHYFMVSRIAPSIHQKYVALAGKFTPSDEDDLGDYEEVFRTWKMLGDEHKEKSEMLFRKFIKGENLEPFYTVNSNGVEYIEFPDQETWYDKDARTWRSEREDVLEPYRKLKEKSTAPEEQ